MKHHGAAFDLGSARMICTTKFKMYFSYHKAKLIAASDYYMCIYLIAPSPLTAIFQLINRSINKF